MQPTLVSVLEVSNLIGRKFTAADLIYDYADRNSDDLARLAAVYAETYTGDFSFMREMKESYRRRALSAGQSAAVLNCAAADARRQAAQAMPPRTLEHPAPPAGRFTIEGTTLRLETDDADPSILFIKRRANGLYGEYWQAFAKITHGSTLTTIKAATTGEAFALETLLASDDPAEYGYLFAVETGCCWRCGRQLDVAASLLRGLGPTCAAIMAGQTPAAAVAAGRGQLGLF